MCVHVSMCLHAHVCVFICVRVRVCVHMCTKIVELVTIISMHVCFCFTSLSQDAFQTGNVIQLISKLTNKPLTCIKGATNANGAFGKDNGKF